MVDANAIIAGGELAGLTLGTLVKAFLPHNEGEAA
jgi:hypothetical protein